MAAVQDVETLPGTAAQTDVHYQTVSQRMPRPLLEASPQQRRALRETLPRPLPWLAGASANLPETLQALRDEYQRHQAQAKGMAGLLAQLPGVEAFAEPLLREALKNTLGMDLDVRHTFLFNAARARIGEAHLTADDPVVKAFQVVKGATQSLLQAALQNFEAFEAEPGGMQDDRRPSSIFISDSGLAVEPSRQVDLVPERFAALCRDLDLGARYQKLIESVFRPAPLAQQSVEAAATNRQAHFKLFEQSGFRLNLHLAWLQSWIDQAMYEDLLEAAKNGSGQQTLERAFLRLWEVDLNGIVLFLRLTPGGALARLVAYLPDEPRQPFQEFHSIQAFHDSLRERLRDAGWRRYFLRFIPARQRDALMQRIHRTLNPKVWNTGGWYEERYDDKAILRLSKRSFSEPLFDALLQRKIAVLKDDALYHAVPTASEDHKSAEDKLEYFLGTAFNVLNVAAFVVPGLGEVMLGVNAALLGYEVYEGFDSLSKGEREEAWGYFMDVAENLALVAAMGAAGAVAPRFQGNLPLAVRSMRPVTLGDGSVRLWKPDLTPFAYDIRLPAGLKPGENGLYDYQGREWLLLEGRYYSVRTLMGTEPGHVLEHPERAWAYEPALRHNGNGGWLHELDTPQQWRGMQLFSRLGHREAAISEPMALRALRISGTSEAQLRQALVNSHRPPALLSDSLRRLVLAERASGDAFVRAYDVGQRGLSPQGLVLQRQFASLPNAVVEEILGAATGHELAEMSMTRRVPLRLAEEARVYQQQVRIARACEGLYLDLQPSLDSARLLLHGLGTLAEWPADLRIALYESGQQGQRLTGIGSGAQGEIALAWREQLPGDFCQALFDVIPADTRTRLGADSAASLRRLLQEQPLAPRQQLRQWLGLEAVKPGFRSPMRLADGRLVYPLSGRGNPFFTEDELLDKLRLLELDDLYVEDALRALYRRGLDRAAINTRLDRALDELQRLRTRLDHWTLDSSREILSPARQRSRERIGAALWDHWRRNVLPELGRPPAPLVLWQVQLADLPLQLPAFFRERVRSVLLDEVILREGPDHEQVIDERAVQALARELPYVVSLDIRSGEWPVGLAQMLARAWRQLSTVGLRELEVLISYQDLRALATLPRLRRLELRGSRLHDMPVSALNGLNLDYLGLDWLDLDSWPHWLDNLALERIGELSMVGNLMGELPAAILEDTDPLSRPVRIALTGNQFSHQALIDLRLSERFQGRFIFDLEVSPAIEGELTRRVQEREQLLGVLQAWSNPLDEALAPAHSAYRQRVSTALLNYWRASLRGPSLALLNLEDVVLADFPARLPGFFLSRIRRLELTRFDAEPAILERFVRQFPHLSELSLVGGLPALESVPQWLTQFPNLRDLALVRMGMTIDQAAMETFALMPVLSSLQLDGNSLGVITDVSMFNQRFFGFLGLGTMGITAWPAWLDGMLPQGIELLSLDGNQLTELPAWLLENRRTENGAVEISLHNNPLTRETQIQAHTSQHYNRPYTFTMDLPEDIQAMERQAHVSDSEESDYDDDELSEDEAAATWQTGDAEQDARYQAIRTRLLARGDADSLMGLVSSLRHSADYRSLATRAELVERVWTVLVAADQDTELRQTLNGMAEEPLLQMHGHETCPDGIRLEFNQMEFQVHTRQALRQVGEANRGPALFRLMRGLFRAQALDRIAREWTRGRDEAEVRLAYRLRWAEQLDLPLPPRSMLYRRVADIAPGELDQALTRLQLEEAGQALLAFGADCDFWAAYLREAFAARFKALRDAYEAAVLATVDSYPDETPEQSAARIRALEDKFKRDERALLERLTLEQAMSGS